MELGVHLAEEGVERGIASGHFAHKAKVLRASKFLLYVMDNVIGHNNPLSSRPKGCIEGSYDMGS